jgi:hypothetical protein
LKPNSIKHFLIKTKSKIRIYQQPKSYKIIELLFFIWIYSTFRKNQKKTSFIGLKKLVFKERILILQIQIKNNENRN